MHNKNTLFVGKVLHHFPTLDSTNRYASELLAKSRPSEGTVISTDCQTQGRGQIGSNWESAPGRNLTISLILYPTFLEARRQFLLNQAMALAVRDVAASYSEMDVKVKWPNDIYVQNEKLAGILIQNTLSGPGFSTSVVGIGLNVNQTEFSPTLPNPTSMCLLSGQRYDLGVLTAELCYHLETRYLQVRENKEAQIQEDYHRHLYRYREKAMFSLPDGKLFEGQIIGVDAQGKLNIDTGEVVNTYGFREIRYVFPSPLKNDQ